MSGLAAEVAFFGVLSIVPWLIVVAAAVGSLETLVGGDVAGDAKQLVTESLNRVLTDQADGAVTAVRELFEEERGGLLTIGALIAVWSSSRGFAAVIAALNLAYEVEEHRSWFAKRSRAVVLALGSIILATLLLVAFVAGPLLGGARSVAGLLGLRETFVVTWSWLRWPIALVLLVGWAALLYRVAPNHRVGWHETWRGALAAAASWLAASAGFGLYLQVAGSANPIFGALGGSLILLVWLYLLAIGLLVGGEVNSILAPTARPEAR